jgi:hypothetical protein
MASFRQHGNGWQARVRRQGHPDITKTFEFRQDAEKWARSLESSIDKGQFLDINEAQRTTLGDVIERYLAEVTPTMKSAVADTIRLTAFMRRPLARLSMVNLSAAPAVELALLSPAGPKSRPTTLQPRSTAPCSATQALDFSCGSN